MNIDEIIEDVVVKLDTYSEEVKSNLRNLINHFNKVENLTELEQSATQISFWRSIDDKSCSVVVERIVDDEYIEIESKFDRYLIFKNWNDCISWKDISNYVENNEELSEELESKLEICYLQWFVKNWYEINGQIAKRIEYFIIENNSVRNFDLQRFNFTDLFNNHKGIQRAKPYYTQKLNDYEIKNRVLMDMVDHTYNKPIIRHLKNENSSIEFWYSNCELKISDISNDEISNILVNKKIKPNENKYEIKWDYLKLIVQQIDILIEKGYKEIEIM